jgi:phosphogluconate dehydratase
VEVDAATLAARPYEVPDLSAHNTGCGRDLFSLFRRSAGTAEHGASALFGDS